MDRDDVTSAGLTVVGVVASTVAKALVLGGRLMAAGLGTLENALRAGEETSAVSSDSGSSRAGRRSGEDRTEADEDGDAGFAPLSEPAFEPADGVTPPARPSRSAIRRSSAAAAARTAPGPRPAKRATAKSLPPNLRPVKPREQAAPVKGAAGAADVAGDSPAATKTAATKAAKKAPTTKAPATKAATKKAAPSESAAKQAPAKKAATKKAAPSESAAEQPAPAESPVEQPSAAETAASAHTAPEGTPDGTQDGSQDGTPDA